MSQVISLHICGCKDNRTRTFLAELLEDCDIGAQGMYRCLASFRRQDSPPLRGTGHVSTTLNEVLNVTNGLQLIHKATDASILQMIKHIDSMPTGTEYFPADMWNTLGENLRRDMKKMRQNFLPNQHFMKCGIFRGGFQRFTSFPGIATEGEGFVIMWKSGEQYPRLHISGCLLARWF